MAFGKKIKEIMTDNDSNEDSYYKKDELLEYC